MNSFAPQFYHPFPSVMEGIPSLPGCPDLLEPPDGFNPGNGHGHGPAVRPQKINSGTQSGLSFEWSEGLT
jgi:hypothetical protein